MRKGENYGGDGGWRGAWPGKLLCDLRNYSFFFLDFHLFGSSFSHMSGESFYLEIALVRVLKKKKKSSAGFFFMLLLHLTCISGKPGGGWKV